MYAPRTPSHRNACRCAECSALGVPDMPCQQLLKPLRFRPSHRLHERAVSVYLEAGHRHYPAKLRSLRVGINVNDHKIYGRGVERRELPEGLCDAMTRTAPVDCASRMK